MNTERILKLKKKRIITLQGTIEKSSILIFQD